MSSGNDKHSMLSPLFFRKMFEFSQLLRNQENIIKIKQELRLLLGYDFQITPIDEHWFSNKPNLIKNKLGQVDTPLWVAELMSKLCIKSTESRILDPCFGRGIFLNTSYERLKKMSKDHTLDLIKQIHGVELDPILFVRGLANFLSKHATHVDLPRNFYNGDIFDFKDNDFDVIIMNPPYVRQENLSDKSISYLDKSIISAKTSSGQHGILSAKSNLYAYFIVHLTKSLVSEGYMGAIVPKVWLDSKYGETLQDFLLKNYQIQFIMDFDKDTFSNVIVEDCVLIMKKSSENNLNTKFIHVKKKIDDKFSIEKIFSNKEDFENEYINMISITKETLSQDHKWGKFLHVPQDIVVALTSKNLTALSNLAKVIRGTTTNWNDFFMLDELKINSFGIDKEFLKPIVKSPKDISHYDIDIETNLSEMLFIEKPIKNNSTGIKKYLKSALESIQKSGQHTTIAEMIKDDPNGWYMIRQPKSGPIIFSYIIRQMKSFVFNSKGYLIRDNFYIITPNVGDPLLLFGILNSSLVRLNLELTGRRYGNGLLKIQTYELMEMPVPDIRKMTEDQKNQVRFFAKKLLKCSINSTDALALIKEIDNIVEHNLKLRVGHERLVLIEKQLMNQRLGRVGRK